MGCTEIPLALDCCAFLIPLIDPAIALARALIGAAGPMHLRTRPPIAPPRTCDIYYPVHLLPGVQRKSEGEKGEESRPTIPAKPAIVSCPLAVAKEISNIGMGFLR